jgi:hypothetical protein
VDSSTAACRRPPVVVDISDRRHSVGADDSTIGSRPSREVRERFCRLCADATEEESEVEIAGVIGSATGATRMWE